MDMDIDPRASGIIEAELVINNVDIDWSTVIEFLPDVDGEMGVETMTVAMEINPSVTALGYIVFSVESVSVTNTGFSFSASGPWDEIADVVVDVEGMVWDMVAEAVEDAVYDTVPDLLNDSLGDVRLVQDFEAFDNHYEIYASVGAVDVDESGIAIHMRTRVLPDVVYGIAADGDGPSGYPAFNYGLPTWGAGTSGSNLALNTDFINQVLFAFFKGGLMNRTLSADDLGLDTATIGLLLPGLTDMIIETEPLLPPVARPRDGDDEWEYELQLGDVHVAVYNGSTDAEDLYMSLYVSTVAPMGLSAGPDGSSLGLELGEPEVKVDVVATSSAYRVSTESTETLFTDLMPLFLPEITGAIGEVPLPSIGGFVISDVSTSMTGSGPTEGFFLLSGDLE